MASENLQALNKQLETENLFNSRGAVEIAVRLSSSSACTVGRALTVDDRLLSPLPPPLSAQAETDQFKCGKCGHRKTTYYQMQTRSADEPMTVSLLASAAPSLTPVPTDVFFFHPADCLYLWLPMLALLTDLRLSSPVCTATIAGRFVRNRPML